MTRGFTRTTRCLASALVLALVVMSSATCLLGAGRTEAQMACCAAMHHKCGSASIKEGCCGTEAPKLTALAPASSLVAPEPAAPTVIVLTSEPDPVRTASVFESSAPATPSRPTYLRVSVFRL